MTLSGLQREVLALYRKCLRESMKKPSVGSANGKFVLLFPDHRYSVSGRISSPSQGQTKPLSPSTPILPASRNPRLMPCESRTEFEKNLALDRKDFGTIEYLLRKGQRQLEIYSSPAIKDVR